MHRPPVGIFRRCLLLVLVPFIATLALAQFETGTVSGQVSDPSGLSVSGAQVNLVDIDRDTSVTATTNNSGLYRFANVHPGRYRMEVRATGFRLINVTGLTVNVQDHLEQNFKVTVGSVSESVTVEGGAPLIDTETATVSTVVDRQFAENLPMNGRSFQTLIQLTPGVVLTASNGIDTGQFSVNGQRSGSNYWMVDGVSANLGISTGNTTGNGLGGTVGAYSVLGGTNSLVSVDALQEFRIETSTFAPEFGRTPGAQISIATRSGTNQSHGSVFNYLRNDILDANDWFANHATLPKAKERQNDFGGTFSGPIFRDKTFYFFSYEGLRLRLPQTALTNVPDLAARQNAVPAMQPFLNAYPLPNSLDNTTTGVAQFNASFSDPASVNAYSLRLDHKVSDKIGVFARYNYSPSSFDDRGSGGSSALSTVTRDNITTQTGTVGMTWSVSPVTVNDFRFNYSNVRSSSSVRLDNFGGGVPLATLPFPSPFTPADALFTMNIFSLGSGAIAISEGKNQKNEQRQINILDSVSMQRRSHAIKGGVDFRRLSPQFSSESYAQVPLFSDVASAETGGAFILLFNNKPAALLFRNLGIFGQDTWRIHPRLTLTYGIRWDVDFTPASINGPPLNAVTGFNLADLSQLSLAPVGTPPFSTKYNNLAPRAGFAYEISPSQKLQTVLRGGFGMFYDLASGEAGNVVQGFFYPFGAIGFAFGTFPLTPPPAPPTINAPTATNGQQLLAFDPHLRLPYSLQWNVALEQALGQQQKLSLSYIGSDGSRLLQTAAITSPNANFGKTQLVTNAATSNYNALQLQFQRRLAHGLQALTSYTWSHSIDTASAGSIGNSSNGLVAALSPNVSRGSSDFDVRHAFTIGVTYDMPAPKANRFFEAIVKGWSVQNVVQARSAPPVAVFYDPLAFAGSIGGFQTSVRPDVVQGQAFYLFGPQYPGGKALNIGAFSAPPLDPATGSPSRQGELARNALRGFDTAQWDFAVHRDFPIHESFRLQFRAEMFNVLNHPNFGPPVGNLGTPTVPNPLFGQSTQMLGQSLSGGQLGAGAFNPLYQVGGPRSIQLALKLQF